LTEADGQTVPPDTVVQMHELFLMGNSGEVSVKGPGKEKARPDEADIVRSEVDHRDIDTERPEKGKGKRSTVTAHEKGSHVSPPKKTKGKGSAADEASAVMARAKKGKGKGSTRDELDPKHVRSAKGTGKSSNADERHADTPPVKPGKGKSRNSATTFASGTTGNVYRRGDGVICLQYAGTSMVDADVEELASRDLPALFGIQNVSSDMECAVDLANNNLSEASALAKLLQSLRSLPLHITTLRLYRNCYDDQAAAVLAEHIREAASQGKPLMQLHVSNNSMTEVGVQRLIEMSHRCRGYPRSRDSQELKSLGADSHRRALWLRAENQDPPIAQGSAVRLIESCNRSGQPVCVLTEADGQTVPPDTVVQMHEFFLTAKSAGFDGKGLGKGKAKMQGNSFNADERRADTARPRKGKGKGTSTGSSSPPEDAGGGELSALEMYLMQ